MRKFSNGCLVAWQIAAVETEISQDQFIEKEHILIGILSLEKKIQYDTEKIVLQTTQDLQYEYNTLLDVLGGFEIDPLKLRRDIRNRLSKGKCRHSGKVIHRSEACKKVFERAGELAKETSQISCLHLLAAIREEPGKVIGAALKFIGIEAGGLHALTLAFVDQKQGPGKKPIEEKQEHYEEARSRSMTPFLTRYGRDLIREAQENRLGPFIGRRKELLQVIQTLARSSKNNPVLVGEAGVGKTAIVEALALRIAEGKDAHILASKRVIELNIGALLGGTKYRGEFEERLARIVAEVQANPEIILFIDEIHNLVGAGRTEGSMDAANLLKPALARGEIRCIGATTVGEYRRYIEQDPALERRFEKVIINEPSPAEALEMLRGIRPKWEAHHNVRITDKALDAAVELSIRFDTDHQLPDKAIDLVDKAGAKTRIPALSMMPGLKKEGPKNVASHDMKDSTPEVTEFTVAQVLSEKVGVPPELISGHLEGVSTSHLVELEGALKKRVIGQDEAVRQVCQRLVMSYAALANRRGPLAVLLFLGPTGVGKTELAKSLAEFLFGNESQLIRFDMSEYMEEHSISKLVGSPPGYVGYEEEGQLTSKLRTRPHSVILFDEIEKGHPRIFDLFLQLFDEGRLTDAKGRSADGRNAIFIMTSNIAAEKHKRQMGFGGVGSKERETAINPELNKWFRPEFINRIDEIVPFRQLTDEDVRKILGPMLDEIRKNLENQHGVDLKIREEVEEFIAQVGYNPQYGVRELRRTVERLIQAPLSSLILSGELRRFASWQVVCTEQRVSIIPNS